MRIFREVNPAGEGGHISNVSSSGGYHAQPNLAYYNAAKFGESSSLVLNFTSYLIPFHSYALEGFAESLRSEI